MLLQEQLMARFCKRKTARQLEEAVEAVVNRASDPYSVVENMLR